MSPDAPTRAAISEAVSFDTREGKWVLAVAVLGSGLAFLDGTVINVALPQIGRDLNATTTAIVGAACLAGFLIHERRSANPMMPLSIFSSRQFSAANPVNVLRARRPSRRRAAARRPRSEDPREPVTRGADPSGGPRP